MHRVCAILRNGDWLTRERIRLVAVALLIASSAGFLFLVVTSHGAVDLQGRPLGTDFSNVYAAGSYVLGGDANAAFDPPQQFAREQAIFGATTQFYGWHYPPYFLFIAAALAWMPYGLALAVWQAATLGLYLLVIRAIVATSFRGPPTGPARSGRPDDKLRGSPESITTETQERTPRPRLRKSWLWIPDSRSAASGMTVEWLLLALAFPAVLLNVGQGQNGFLTAALLGGALVVLDRRPILAGILFGLLVYKPQYGLMLPIVLGVSGRWKCFGAAAATVVILTIATTLTFGASVWGAFLELDTFHAHRGARTGQYRLVQDPKRICLGPHVGRADPGCLCAARRHDRRARRRTCPAVARRRALSAPGCGALPRDDSRDALQLRL